MTRIQPTARWSSTGRRRIAQPRDRLRLIRFIKENRPYCIMVVWLVAVFILGGSSRADTLSLLILRPISVLVLFYGLSGLNSAQIRENRFLLGMAAAWLALPLLQLVPLPPGIWHALPGRQIIIDVDRQAGLGDPWRPLSMVPYATRNAAWALLAPIATLVLGVRIRPAQRRKIFVPIIVLGFLSAGLGVLQILGEANGPLYFYVYTNNGSPVGLLANRNHQALLLACLLPILAAWALAQVSSSRESASHDHQSQNVRRGVFNRVIGSRWVPASAGAAVLVPLILLTGSRTGIALGLVGIVSLPLGWLVGQSLEDRQRGSQRNLGKFVGWGPWFFLAGLLGLASLTALMGRGLSLDRFRALDLSGDARTHVLPIVLSLIKTYSPWGSGLGTFEQVYYLKESDGLLAETYMNHAHDDWLELVLTGGIPGVALTLVGLGGLAVMVIRRLTHVRERVSGVPEIFAGFIMIIICSLASLTDYPLRVPSLSCLAAIAVVFIASAKKPWGRATRNAQIID